MKVKLKLPDILFIVCVTILITSVIASMKSNNRFDIIERELSHLRLDHDTIKLDLDTLKYKTDTLLMDVKDLKIGQKFIYDEVKKNNSINFFDLFN